uniref:Uncharacterized protein n=1 Tax=Haemonchus contortus TaxID=6289 RepID=A0A7I4XUV0_HAECO
MSDRIQQHEQMMRYIRHRERVLDMQSVVKSQIARSRSAPPRKNSQKQAEARRRIDLGNERVLQSLMNISARRQSKPPGTPGRRNVPSDSSGTRKRAND